MESMSPNAEQRLSLNLDFDLDSSFFDSQTTCSSASTSFSSHAPFTPTSGRSTPSVFADFNTPFSSFGSFPGSFDTPQPVMGALYPQDSKPSISPAVFQNGPTQFNHGLATPALPVTPSRRHSLADSIDNDYDNMMFDLSTSSSMVRDVSAGELDAGLEYNDGWSHNVSLSMIETPTRPSDSNMWDQCSAAAAIRSPIQFSFDKLPRWRNTNHAVWTGVNGATSEDVSVKCEDTVKCEEATVKCEDLDLPLRAQNESLVKRRLRLDKARRSTAALQNVNSRSIRAKAMKAKDVGETLGYIDGDPVNVHKASKPMHPCRFPGCHKSFRRPEHLKRHKAVAHGQEQSIYICICCEKNFIHRRDNYMSHLELHARPRPKCRVKYHSAAAAELDRLKRLSKPRTSGRPEWRQKHKDDPVEANADC